TTVSVQQRKANAKDNHGANGQTAGGGEAAAPAPTWAWKPRSSMEFFARDSRPTWLVERLLVADQPAVIGGIAQGMKTSIGIDLCVSLASKTPFLGHFKTIMPLRVAVLSYTFPAVLSHLVASFAGGWGR